MFSDNPSGSKPTSPTMVPSNAGGASRKGIEALFAIMTVFEVADEDEGAFFTPEGPRATGEGTNAWAPAQHTASNATDFMTLALEIVSHEEVQRQLQARPDDVFVVHSNYVREKKKDLTVVLRSSPVSVFPSSTIIG